MITISEQSRLETERVRDIQNKEAPHQTREPLDHFAAVGFEVEELKRSKLGIVERVVARKPG